MDILHLCRLCLKTSGYHFNIFTEIIYNKHLYQFINNICDLGVFANDGYPEHICENCFQSIGNIISFKTQAKETEAALTRMKRYRNMISTEQKEEEKEDNEEEEDNEEAVDPSFDHSTVNQLFIKTEIDIDEISIEADQVEMEKITEMEESASWKHVNEMESIPAVIEKSESQEFSEDRRWMECHHCGERRETKQEIAEHIVDVHNSIFNEDNTPFQQQRRDKKHTCSMCERRFKNKSDLARHMRKHTGEKPFQCNICNYSCSISGNIKRHMRKHTGEKPFQCNVCNYSCSDSGYLKRHMRKHTGEKPYQCNICNYRCSQSGHFKVHMRMHNGEKPFQCSICNYSFSRSGEVKRHMRKHTGEKPFQCNICNYRCSQSGRLKSHMQKHT